MSHVYTAGRGRRMVMALTAILAVTIFLLAEGAASAYAVGSPSPSPSAAASSNGISSTMWYVIGVVVAFGGALVVVLLKQRGDGPATGE